MGPSKTLRTLSKFSICIPPMVSSWDMFGDTCKEKYSNPQRSEKKLNSFPLESGLKLEEMFIKCFRCQKLPTKLQVWGKSTCIMQIVYWNDDAKKGREFLVKVSEKYCPYHHYRCTHIKVSLTQVGQCRERQNSEEEITLTDTVWLVKILQNQIPLPSLKLEHLNWI